MFVTVADAAPAWLVFEEVGCVDGEVIEDGIGGSDAPGTGVAVLLVLAGTSFVSVVGGVAVAPGSGGSSGRSGIGGTVGEDLFAFGVPGPELLVADLFGVGVEFATGIAVGGGVPGEAVEGQAGALPSVESDAPLVAASGGTPSGG